MDIFLIVICAVVLILAIWRISKNRTAKTVLTSGAILIGVGLVCSLYVYLGPKASAPEQFDFLKNFFLIISSIGANLVASSALIEPCTQKNTTVAPSAPSHPTN